ncbi:MAG: M15 family metallopeptidase [Verrucomicrobiota bacterium]|nr:M15 family metallopeptidase [Chthoniobacterales bacterium]MDQ3625957.1 M15 family metallopeptidase [Verrucomicrobiota bacterium]
MSRFLLSSRLGFGATLRAVAVLLTLTVAAPSRAVGTEPDLVNVRSIDPTIAVELRYAGTRNVTGRPLYPSNMPALLRPSVAQKVADAHRYLRTRGFGLKIWDAYRPKATHDQLWDTARNSDYVADPTAGRGSLHTWGVAIDATLVTARGAEVKMPTDFDEFTPAAMLKYTGPDKTVGYHLRLLQSAMARAGFYGMRTEWWHFVVKDWQNYRAIPAVTIVSQTPAPATPAPPAPATSSSNGATGQGRSAPGMR